jgi:hypothetical protein
MAPIALRVVMLLGENQLNIPLVNVDLSTPQGQAAY